MVTAPIRLRDKTYADYLALPEGQKAELIDGELFMSPSPKGVHVRVASLLGTELGFAFGTRDGPTERGPGGWWILDEPECHLILGRRVVIPDLAGWRRERMRNPPEGHKFMVVPDWICEVLSPSTFMHDLNRKLPRYLEAGVEFAWTIDPRNQSITASRALEGEWVDVGFSEGPSLVRFPPFEELELDTTPLWNDDLR